MPAALSDVLQRPEARRTAVYFGKAAVLVAALLLLGRMLPLMPAFGVGLIWALISGVSAVGLAYHAVIRKTHRHLQLREGGRLARLNSGRILSLIVGLVVSAIFVAGLFLEAPKWGVAEWCLVVLAVPTFAAVYAAMGNWLKSEYEQPYQTSRTVLASCGVVGVLMCLLYMGLGFAQPAPEYTSLAEAYLSTPQPFAGSPSPLMSEVGKVTALIDGLTAYGLAKAGQVSVAGYLVWRCALCASAFFGVANLLGMCALEMLELQKVFLPLSATKADAAESEVLSSEARRTGEAAEGSQPCERADCAQTADGADGSGQLSGARAAGGACEAAPAGAATSANARALAAFGKAAPRKIAYPPVRRYIAVAVVLPACLLVAFCIADGRAGDAVRAEGYTAAETFVRDQVDLAVYLIDGKYYEQQAVEELLAEAHVQAEQLSDDAKAALVPLINESFDARLANVDGYLDWYYSLPADYERLASLVVGTAEQYASDQFAAKIDEGVDDSGIEEALQNYAEQAAALQESLVAQLAEHEVANAPAWMMTVADEVDLTTLAAEPLEPSRKLLDAPARLGASAAAGIGAGIIAKRLVEKAITKAFYKQVVKKVAGTLSSKAAASAAGGAVGSIGGPAGTVVGVAAGAAASVGVDYVLLMVDEQLNRQSYRDEIAAIIEDGRAEMLSLVQ